MATELTTPVERADLTSQAITYFDVRVPHVYNDTTGEMDIDKDRVVINYAVESYNADGVRIKIERRSVPFASWPAAFITAMKDVYGLMYTDAKNNGLIGAGTDEPLE